ALAQFLLAIEADEIDRRDAAEHHAGKATVVFAYGHGDRHHPFAAQHAPNGLADIEIALRAVAQRGVVVAVGQIPSGRTLAAGDHVALRIQHAGRFEHAHVEHAFAPQTVDVQIVFAFDEF